MNNKTKSATIVLTAMMAVNGGLPAMPYCVTKYMDADTFTCKHCRKEFKSVSHNRKTFCSAECYKAYYKSLK